MGTHRSACVVYGIRVCDSMNEDMDPERREEIENEQVGKPVQFAILGAYDEGMGFLVIGETWKRLEAGEVRYIEPYNATHSPYPGWDWGLVQAAEEYGLPVLSRPAWMFIPNEG